MGKVSRNLLVATALVAVGLIGYQFVPEANNTALGKQAPIDARVIEGVRQARALQKAGKLEEAVVELERYVSQGHPAAMFFLAKSYMNGWGVKPDLEKARELFMHAVEYNFDFRGESAYKLGRLYEQSKGDNCQTIAVAWFLKALDWHYLKAHRQLGIHYEQGLGVEQDVERAVRHYEKAAEAGYETVSLRLARSLASGRYGLKIDVERALGLARRAIIAYEVKAANGSGSAAKVLGRLYRDGEFVEQSNEQAIYWFRRASLLEDPGGMHELALLMLAGKPTDQAVSEALGWLRLASKLDHGGAMTALGRLHLKEKYGLSKQEAAYWFEKGVAASHGGSMEALARLKADGILLPKDIASAITLARKGADLGHAGARSYLRELLSASKGKTNPTSDNS